MNFEASRAKAIDKLNNFVENNLSDYSKLRNFDFGPDKRNNVSCSRWYGCGYWNKFKEKF